MNEKTWNRIRQMGKSRYLLIYGILSWSLGCTLLFGLMELITQGEIVWIWIPVRLMLFAVVGFFVGNARWQRQEKKYGNPS